MKNDIEKNRYNPELFLAAWKNADKESSRAIVLGEIEFEGYEEKYEYMMGNFLQNISEIDNIVQQFCIESYQESGDDIDNYILDMSWVELQDNKVCLGYWGRFVNIELRADFIFHNEKWEMEEIYFQ